jgi:hypothetical protein
VANLETQEPIQPDDIFGIGSVTKGFTAATVLKTVESGKLSLDDTLGQWLPDVAERIPDGEDLTLRQTELVASMILLKIHNIYRTLQMIFKQVLQESGNQKI